MSVFDALVSLDGRAMLLKKQQIGLTFQFHFSSRLSFQRIDHTKMQRCMFFIYLVLKMKVHFLRCFDQESHLPFFGHNDSTIYLML